MLVGASQVPRPRRAQGTDAAPLLSHLTRWATTGAFRHVSQRFLAATTEPQRAQMRVLQDLTVQCARTQYGAAHGVRTSEHFLERLPVVGYPELEPWLHAQRRCERNVIVADKVLFYEKTSGSAGPAKYIPYTAALRRSFSRMFAVWARDLLRHGPGFESFAFYFSISPSFAPQEATAHGIPVGLDDDADYLGPTLRRALSSMFVVPEGAASARDAATWKRLVARALVLRGDLEIISVWNPSMLTVLLDEIERDCTYYRSLLGADPRRVAFRARTIDWTVLWPSLKLVSCWTSASAAALARALIRRLPGVLIQGKGLLATEAPLTLPLLSAAGFVPMIDEVFYELEDVETKHLSLLHEAKLGRTYELVISQRGGLSRYRIGDRVRATHFYGATPCLDFVGRGRDTSDLVGEKLHETFVEESLRALVTDTVDFWCLLPVRRPHDHYALLTDRAPSDLAALAQRVDQALRRSHHYEHARALGQLGPVRVVVSTRAAECVRDHHIRRGMKWGDIKPRCLLSQPADDLLQQLDTPP